MVIKSNSILFIALSLLFGCNRSRESDSINVVVTNKGDTLSHVNYPKIPGYDFFSKAEKHSVFLNPSNLSRFPGELGFGIRSKEQPMTSCWLVFQKVGEKSQVDDVRLIPFLYGEYKIDQKVKVDLIYNYVDSLQEQPTMYQVYAAVSAVSNNDTLLYQETAHLIQKGNRFTALIVYKDKKKREEMRQMIEQFAHAMKSSYGEQ